MDRFIKFSTEGRSTERHQGHTNYAQVKTHHRTNTMNTKDLQNANKKIPFDAIGTFTAGGRFYFNSTKEIKRMHAYYKLLSDQRYRYTKENQRSRGSRQPSLPSTRSKTKILFEQFEKDSTANKIDFCSTIKEATSKLKLLGDEAASTRPRPQQEVSCYDLYSSRTSGEAA